MRKKNRESSHCTFFFSFFALCAMLPFAAVAESPREIFERSRSLTSGESIRLLESNLPSAGELRPYYLLDLARLSAEKEEWKESLEWSEKQDASSVPAAIADSVTYWYAIALEHNGQERTAAKVARARLDTGLVRDPLVYLAYFRTASSGAEELIERFDRAFPVLKNTDPETFALSRYLSGLCAVREGNWPFAALSFSRFSPSRDSAFPDLAPWSHYYLGYVQYRLGKWTDAITEFKYYLDTWKNHAFSWRAATTAAFASIQAGADPLPFADRAISLAPSASDLASSLLLRATILFDRKRYAEAESALSGIADGSATRGQTQSAPRAQFMLAEISVRLKKNDEAEDRWLSLASRFPKDPLAEESLYRAGELRYLNGEWNRAAGLFSQYRQSFPSGRFLDSVLRMGGDANYRNGGVDLAIIWWEELARKYPESPTIPRTLGDLVGAYRRKGEYASALRTAETYRKRFPSESVLDGMDAEIAELTRLRDGETEEGVALYGAWTKAKGATTAEGRSAGVRLAKRYLDDYGKRNDAKDILRAITATAPKKPDLVSSTERGVFATAWALLGNIYREENDFKEASRCLLSAGNFYAAIDGERSAEALYGAADSFLQAGLRSDARTTVDTLEQNWPQSVWTKRALILMER